MPLGHNDRRMVTNLYKEILNEENHAHQRWTIKNRTNFPLKCEKEYMKREELQLLVEKFAWSAKKMKMIDGLETLLKNLKQEEETHTIVPNYVEYLYQEDFSFIFDDDKNGYTFIWRPISENDSF